MLKVLACSECVVEKVMGPPQRGLVHSVFASAANLSFANGFLLSLNASPASNVDTHMSHPQFFCRTEKMMASIISTRGKTEASSPFFPRKKGRACLCLPPCRDDACHHLLPAHHGSSDPRKAVCRDLQKSGMTHIDESYGPLMPNGLLLAAHKGTYPFTELKIGMPVVLGAGWLTLESLSCALDCTSCSLWNPHIEHSEVLNIELIRDNARQLSTLCQLRRPPEAGTQFFYADDETLPALAERLCGRGPGLTPSGDDFLAGWMAVSWLLYGPQPAFLASCRRVNEIAGQRTHALSQCWLAYAAAGNVASPIGELLTALTQPDCERLERATAQVLALGATSGYDLLQGILYGIKQFPHC